MTDNDDILPTHTSIAPADQFDADMAAAAENPKAIIGDNYPPEPITLRTADDLLAHLTTFYVGLSADTASLLADIRSNAPATVETESDNGIIAAYMERLRSTIKTADNHREHEKAPYLKAERTAQQFFASMTDRLGKARDILQARGNDYTRRKVAAERAERERIARETAEEARRKAAEERRLAQEAADLAAAAARARKPENIEKLEDAAQITGAAAAIAQVDTLIANGTAENAMLAAAASSADIARTRHETGHLSTAKQVPHVEITDSVLLDSAALWPFIKEDEKLRALKSWAKIHSHKKPMAGAVIEMRDDADYR